VPLKKGQHHAYAGRPYPSRQCYVPVHHFKWTGDVFDRLEARARALREGGAPQWTESARFVEYCRSHENRIDLNDPNLWVGECSPEYPHWEMVKKIMTRAPVAL
jgi:hypothetical protein